VKGIEIAGNSYFKAKQIKAVMRTKQSKWLRPKHLMESTLETDLAAIDALYKRNGFLKDSLSVERKYDTSRNNVWLTLKIVEGPRFFVKNVEIEGNVHVATPAVKKILVVKAEKPFDDRQVSEDKYNIYAYYADRGYVFASIESAQEFSDTLVTVKYIISEGAPAAVSAIDVAGNTRVASKLIKREVTLKPGDTFSRKKLLLSQQNLYDSGFFRDVEIDPVPSTTDSLKVDLNVIVKERKMREVSSAIGYSTRDETRLTAGWLHRNLWNSGRHFEVSGVIASRDFSKGLTRKRADIALSDRWLFGRRVLGIVSLFGVETLEDYKPAPGEYTLDRVGVTLSAQKDFTPYYKLWLSYTHELVRIHNLSFRVTNPDSLRISLGQEVSRYFQANLERDRRRPFFDPHNGSLTRITARRAGGIFGGDNSYNKYTLSYARYLPVTSGTTLALGIRLGQADAFGKSRTKGVPEYEQFFAGGSSTIRGYNEQEFGPGDFLGLVNIEVRYAVVWKLMGVLFLDAGNAWTTIDDVTAKDFRFSVPAAEFGERRARDCKYTVGVGIGIETPVGPARIDYGMKLKRGLTANGKKEPLGMVHFNIGHIF
jgi:outer membrane protein insertion porin family